MDMATDGVVVRGTRRAGDEVARLLGIDSPDAVMAVGDCLIAHRRLEPGAALWSDDGVAILVRDGLLRLSRLMPDGRRHVDSFPIRGDLLDVAPDNPEMAEAILAADLLVLDRERLAAAAEHACVRRALHGRVAAGLLAAQERMVILGRYTAAERVAWFLLQTDARTDPGRLLHLPMSRADIADHLGLTQETVCRVLTRLAREGAVLIRGRDHLEVLDRPRLAALASAEADPGPCRQRHAA